MGSNREKYNIAINSNNIFAEFTIEKQSPLQGFHQNDWKSFNFITVCWDTWIKKRVNHLEGKRVIKVIILYFMIQRGNYFSIIESLFTLLLYIGVDRMQIL